MEGNPPKSFTISTDNGDDLDFAIESFTKFDPRWVVVHRWFGRDDNGNYHHVRLEIPADAAEKEGDEA